MTEKTSEKACVYDIVLNGEVVYVGMTGNPKKRLREHRYTGVAPLGSEMHVHRWYESRKAAFVAEAVRQSELKPPLCMTGFRVKGSGRKQFDFDANKKAFDDFNAAYTVDQVAGYLQSLKESKTHREWMAVRPSLFA